MDSATTDTQQVVANPDGTFTLTSSTVPVRVQQDGAWVSTDSTLAQVDGGLAPKAAEVPVVFSSDGSSDVAKVQAPSGQWLSESWTAGPLPAPNVAGSTATYSDVLPGVDLDLTATATGMSQVLVIKSAAAAQDPGLSSINFGISDGSLTVQSTAGGTAVATDPSGSSQLISSAATWWDSSTAGSSAQGPGGLGVQAPVPAQVSDTSMSVDAATVAQQPGVTYPVYVDPPWTGSAIGWSFVDSDYPDTAYWKDSGASDSYQHVGYVQAGDGDHLTRSYWQMAIGPVAGATILSAHLDMTEVYSYSCSARQVDLMTAGAAPPSTTWNTRPVESSFVDSANVAYGYSSSCPGHAVGFDAQAPVQRAADRGGSDVNFELRAHAESDQFAWKKFAAAASLVITYNNPPDQPTGLQFSQPQVPCVTGASRPYINNHYAIALAGRVSDPDQGDTVTATIRGTSLGGGVQYFTSSTSGLAYSGAWAGYTVPANTIADGTSFKWYMYATDNHGAVGPNSDFCEATIDDTPPSPPTVGLASGQAAPMTVGQATAMSLTSIASDHVVRYLVRFADAAAVSPGPAAPVQNVGPNYALPACGSYNSGVLVVCADASGNASLTVAPIDQDSTLYVASVDAAGNVSAGSGGTQSSTGYEFSGVSGDAADFETGHAWRTDQVNVASPPATVADETTGTPGALTPNAQVGWATSTVAPNTTSSVMTFNGTSSLASSTVSPDITKPFTVAAWLYPTGSANRVYTAMSDDPGSGSTLSSGLDLQYYPGAGASSSSAPNGYWRFCMPNSTAAPQCATTQVGTLAMSRWSFVAGEWDPVNHTLRLFLNGGLAAAAPHVPNTSIAKGQLVVGRAWWNSAVTDWYSGAIESPIFTPSMVDGSELANLSVAGPNTTAAGTPPFFKCTDAFNTVPYSCG